MVGLLHGRRRGKDLLDDAGSEGVFDFVIGSEPRVHLDGGLGLVRGQVKDPSRLLGALTHFCLYAILQQEMDANYIMNGPELVLSD